ncbi:MAG: methenyltetrahydromethanopterin cyclohydrolase [Rubrivivax sp.]
MTLSINALAQPLVERLIADAEALRIQVRRDPQGCCHIDAGLGMPGSVQAGLRIAEICLGGLGRVRLRGAAAASGWPTWVDVRSDQPVLACLASQYAGWSLAATKEETGGRKFQSLASGPARALAGKEKLYQELDYRDRADSGVLVLEVDRETPQFIVDKLLRDCGLTAPQLTLITTPTTSLAGTTQVVARVLEVALHKAHTLGFALSDIVGGQAAAPLPLPSPDAVQAMGRTNDAILYGGQVQLTVRGDDAAAQRLAQRLPSRNAAAFGTPFAELFESAGFDFYALDAALFAPAEVWVCNIDSGNTWHAGGLEMALLQKLWLREA